MLFPNSKKGMPDWEVLMNHLKREGRIRKPDLIKIIKTATAIFRKIMSFMIKFLFRE